MIRLKKCISARIENILVKTGNFSQELTGIVALFCILMGFTGCVASGVVSGWQTVNVTPWAQVDIPPGWTYGAVANSTTDPDVVTLDALSPNQETLLQYIFDRNPAPASAGELKRAQDRMMGEQGFCECQYEPQFTENDGSTAMKQTYYKGSDQGAVVCSASYPGWGRYQYSLIMNGASAVGDYYEDMPEKLADHIRQVNPNNTASGI